MRASAPPHLGNVGRFLFARRKRRLRSEQFSLRESQAALSIAARGPLAFLYKGRTMNYPIIFATAAVAGLYLIIIWECLRHSEW